MQKMKKLQQTKTEQAAQFSALRKREKWARRIVLRGIAPGISFIFLFFSYYLNKSSGILSALIPPAAILILILCQAFCWFIYKNWLYWRWEARAESLKHYANNADSDK
jgi:Mn2+/Fe2+ NRAMP family transporter